MRAFVVLAVVLVAVFGVVPARVRACSCEETDPERAVAEAAAIFEGRVLGLTPVDEGAILGVRFAVTRAWKGISGEAVELRTAGDGAMCGYGFEAGRTYLVYAYAAGSGGADLRTGLCTRTRPIEEAGADLAVLGEGVVPVDPTLEDPRAPTRPRSVEPAPGSGGCASCAVGAPAPRAAPSPLVLLALVAIGARLRGSKAPKSRRS